MADFKIPATVPQDLLLIYDIVGPPNPSQSQNPIASSSQDDVDSSDSDTVSEDEIEAELKDLSDVEPSPSDSSSSSDSGSESDSDSEGEKDQTSKERKPSLDAICDDEDEETGQTGNATAYVHTKNEILDAEISVPTIQQVEPNETLEEVGEIMSVVGNVVIVRGLPSGYLNRAAHTALDSDTLLVFDDRKVMGYIYETFGPTSQPLYQVRFSQSSPIDPDSVRVGRKVFHVPQRSKFVFVERIKHLKGSDASNVHDEEPGEDEIEFSDDEAEAAHKSSLRQQRRAGSRAGSAAPTRRATFSTLPDHEQDISIGNAFDEHGPYDDVHYNTGPQRPRPEPYDDPYAEPGTSFSNSSHTPSISVNSQNHQDRGYDLARGRGHGRRGGRSRGRGRGAERDRGRFGIHGVLPHPSNSNTSGWPNSQVAALKFAPQFPTTVPFNSPEALPSTINSVWQHTFQPEQQGHYPTMPMMIQPHINPRFVTAFGFNLSGASSQPFVMPHNSTSTAAYDPVESLGPSTSSEHRNWLDQWDIQRGAS